jgi:transposase
VCWFVVLIHRLWETIKNDREASAFVGLTPKKHSSGGKVFMTGIDRAGGIRELRSALDQGALSYICNLSDEPKSAKQEWLIKLVQRAGLKRSCIALANKTVRTARAKLRYENKYEQQQLLTI